MKIVAASTLLCAYLFALPSAGADSGVSDFLSAVKADGVFGTLDAIVANGRYVCSTLASGHTADQVVIKLIHEGDNIDVKHAQVFVAESVRYLCPHPVSAPKGPVKKVPLPVFNNSNIIHDILV